ncbi:hypothetical protein sr02614 [Sporisorium reilianum SRZ2]|uniref:Mig1 protein n=1 Tax=Sporisorium reilianum (strain SRZ2) TaxID=999809 RepID=E7A2B6_SPORE|nr:hypothetical protein sr02614 [Sporisorium reilianum SRZ2]
MSTTQRSAFSLAFGLLLAFLQVILVVAEGDVVCSTKPPVLPSNDLYTQHCPHDKGDRSGRKWPCFTHSSGSLHGADISRSTSDDQFDNDSLLLAKDADLVFVQRRRRFHWTLLTFDGCESITAFTPRDQNKAFAIVYHQAGVKIEFNPLYNGCCVLAVKKIDPNSEYRLFITFDDDDDPNNVTLDSDKQGSNETICVKNYFIHLRKEKPKAN